MEFVSHVEARSVEQELTATRGTVARMEQILEVVKGEMHIFQRSAMVEQDEIRLKVAEDFLSMFTEVVRTVDDLRTSTWVTKIRNSSKESLLPLDTKVSEDSATLAVSRSESVLARLYLARLRTDVVEAFRRRPRLSRMEEGCSYSLKLSLWDGSLFFGLRDFRAIDHLFFTLAFLAILCCRPFCV